jgi:plastocyanin
MDRRPHLPQVRRPLLATALVVVLAVGIAACGDDDSSDASSGTTTSAGGGATDDAYGSTGGDSGDAEEGTIIAKDFSLTDLTVAPGDEIHLKNEGDTTHTATADDGEFDLGRVEPGETAEGEAPEEPGSYPFHCEIHPNMTATLTVEG